MKRHARLTGLGIGIALLGPGLGCSSVDNERLSVSPEPLPSMEFDAPGIDEATAPSVVSLDRANWTEHELHASADWTEHYSAATRVGPRFTDESRRQKDQAPNPESALDMNADGGAQIMEGFAGPFWAAADLILIIPRMIGRDFETSGGTGWVAMQLEDAPATNADGSDVPDAADPEMDDVEG